MKLEVGMYVRLQNDAENIVIINRIANVFETTILTENDGSIYQGEYTKENVIKASFDITDLIKAGDVVTFKNDEDVYRVSCIPNKESACDCFYLVFNYATQYGAEDIEVSKEIMQNTLESVITREQFEKIAYKVGDDK